MPAPSDAYGAAVYADTPLDYWRLGEPSGTTATDTMASSNGTYTNTAGITYGQTGLVGSGGTTAVLLNGTTGYVALGSVLGNFSATAAYSVECWVKITGAPVARSTLVQREDGSATAAGWSLYLETDRTLIALRGDATGFDSAPASGATALSTGTWHQVVMTYGSNTLSIFLDGAAYGTTQASTRSVPSLSIAADIGYDAAATGFFLPGTIGEVAIYNVALTLAKVQAHYTAGTTVPGQVSHVTSIVANASTWTDQVGSSVSADLVTALDDSTATYIKSPGNPAGSGPITIHTGPLSKPNAGDRNFVIGLQKSANTGTMDYTVECKKSGGASVQTFNKDASAGATLVAALGNVASTGATATCTVTNAIADGDWANGFDWVVTPLKSA